MAHGCFETVIQEVLKMEGGKVNHPKDPGGRTNMGITQRVYDSHRRANGLPLRSVYEITLAEVMAIYRNRYWNVVRAEQLPKGVDAVVTDGAVNSGPSRSAKWLQRALGDLYQGKIDGVVGDMTIEAVDQHKDHDKLIMDIITRRMRFLKALRTWKHFGRGWGRRVEHIRWIGVSMASGSIIPDKPFKIADGCNAKAYAQDAKKAPSKAPADSAVGGGIATTAITQSTEQLTPLASGNEFIANLVAILTIAGIVVTVGGIVYRIWAKQRQAELEDALDVKE